jgi:DNA polymerase III epsilon subunit family exonuclease
MDEQISGHQRTIIEFDPGQGHMLVIAAPGSGKTRVITERIGYLLEQGLVEPEQIVVMTFTERAAKELLERLGERLSNVVQGMQVGTIHNTCNRLLEDHAAVVGLKPTFKIYDALRQEEVLRAAATSIGQSLDDRRQLSAMKEALSKRKRQGHGAGEQRSQPPFDHTDVLALDQAYRQLLKENDALDFDDLILKGTELFTADSDTASQIHHAVRYVFVDEFHDLSPEQFIFLARLAPPMMPDRQVVVVADPNQAIYGWRDADATRSIRTYRRRYAPQEFLLEENYRSAGNLARAAHHMITAGGAHAKIIAVHPDELSIDVVTCTNAEEEARWLARQIKKAYSTGQYSYSDIALLYRANWRANILEATLLYEGIPLQRYQENRFFDDPDVQATLRYLSLIQALRDEQFEPSLHWPRVLVDEVTMADLQRLAATENIPLSTLARDIDAYADRVSPLTRTLVKDFLALFDGELTQVADKPISSIIQRLLAVLKRHRSPITRSVRENLKGILESLERPLGEAVVCLDQAVAAGRPVVLAHTGEIDSVAGATIIGHILTHYFQHPVEIGLVGAVALANAFVIVCGEAQPVSADGFGIAIYQTPLRTLTYSISTQAWRIGQMLLMRYETQRNGRFLVFDLETTGTHVKTTEILELAALEVIGGRETPQHFHAMARPNGRISPDASRVHGITEEQVRNKPPIGSVLPDYLAFLGDATLVGHNVASFDYPVLARIGTNLGLTPPPGPIIDTCTLARRLLPDNSHRLEALAQLFGFKDPQTHRALDDVRLNAHVFFKLLDMLDREREIDIAGEVLPLVALGIHASGVALNDYNLWLAQAGARARASGLGIALTEQMHEYVTDTWALTDNERWLATISHIDTEEDRRWDELSQRWQETLKIYQQTFDDRSLGAFLRYVELASTIDPRHDDYERVTLMTIHSAKGMEWPLVFVVGAEDGSIPSFMAKTEQEIEEERRILYVAMTRAKRRLCLSCIASWKGYNKEPSRFLRDIPAELVTTRILKGNGPR